jgi:hypothetical protein
MSEKDIQFIMDFLEGEIRRGVTAEEALQDLMEAGILDETGEYTPAYKEVFGSAK